MKVRSLLLLGAVVALSLTTAAAVANAKPASLFTSPWQALSAPDDAPIDALAASPSFAADHTLFAATTGGIHRSSDAGQSWTVLGAGPAGVISDTTKIVPSPAYSTDHTLFLLTNIVEPPGRRVLRSTDNGASWQAIWESTTVQDLAVSPAYASDGTLFLAGADFSQPQVYRSTDRGDTWLPTGGQPSDLDAYRLAISPNYAVDHTLFVAGYGPLQRSTDGGASWQRRGAAGPNYSLAISPRFAADHTVWAMYREIEGSAMQPEAGVIRSTDGGNTWSNVTAGLHGNYNMNYRSLTSDPAGEAVYLALTGPEWDPRFPPRVYRSDTGGLRWAPQALLPGGAAPDQVLALGALPDLFVLAEGVAYRYASTCYETLADGDFETDPDLLGYAGIARAWDVPVTRCCRPAMPKTSATPVTAPCAQAPARMVPTFYSYLQRRPGGRHPDQCQLSNAHILALSNLGRRDGHGRLAAVTRPLCWRLVRMSPTTNTCWQSSPTTATMCCAPGTTTARRGRSPRST